MGREISANSSKSFYTFCQKNTKYIEWSTQTIRAINFKHFSILGTFVNTNIPSTLSVSTFFNKQQNIFDNCFESIYNGIELIASKESE